MTALIDSFCSFLVAICSVEQLAVSLNVTDVETTLKSVSVSEAVENVKSELSEVGKSAGDGSSDQVTEVSAREVAGGEHKDPSTALDKLVDADQVKKISAFNRKFLFENTDVL
jgi:hypothetical protein